MRALLALLVTLVSISTARAADLMRDLFGCRSNDVCVIRFSDGGDVHSFEQAVREARILGTRIIIDGQCRSACVIFASEVRDQVCLTPHARMMVHRGYRWRVYGPDMVEIPYPDNLPIIKYRPFGYLVIGATYEPHYGHDINGWARANNALHPNPLIYTTIPWGQALQFWKACP